MFGANTAAVVVITQVGPSENGTTRSYRSSRREAQARRTRQRILDAARSVFVARGYAAATMRAIAPDATRPDHALIDRHFLRKHGAQSYYGQKKT